GLVAPTCGDPPSVVPDSGCGVSQYGTTGMAVRVYGACYWDIRRTDWLAVCRVVVTRGIVRRLLSRRDGQRGLAAPAINDRRTGDATPRRDDASPRRDGKGDASSQPPATP